MAPPTGGSGPAKDHYALLEVTMAADGNAISASYRRLARMKHPDKNRENPNATAEFQAIQEAYSVLKDESRRQEYDRKLMLRSGGAGGLGVGGMHKPRPPASKAYEAAAASVAAAAAEMVRKSQRQQSGARSFDKYEGGESLNQNASGDGTGQPRMNPRRPPKMRNSWMPWETHDAGSTRAEAGYAGYTGGLGSGGGFKSGFNTGGFNTGGMGASFHYNVPPSYPPGPPDEPKWPTKPPPKDHALEKQIRETRKDIRAEEKTIRRLGRASKKAASSITALWATTHGITDQIAHANHKKAQLEQSLVTDQWCNLIFGMDGLDTIPAPPLAQPSAEGQAKVKERLKKNQLTIDSLQEKLDKAHAEIDGAMGQSRSIVATIQEANNRKAAKEVKLNELCRRWRIHEFGASSVGADDDSWHGWAGWDEADVEAESDDDEDDYEDEGELGGEYNKGEMSGDELHASGWTTAMAAASGLTRAEKTPNISSWYKSGAKQPDTKGDQTGDDTTHSRHGDAPLSYHPMAKEWTPGASATAACSKTESSSSGSTVDGGKETQGDNPKQNDNIKSPVLSSPGKKDLEGLVFGGEEKTIKDPDEVPVQGDTTESVKAGTEADEEVQGGVEPAQAADTSKTSPKADTDQTSDEEQLPTLARNYDSGYTRSFAYYRTATSQQQQHPILSHNMAFPNYGQYEDFEQYAQYSPSPGYGQHVAAEDYTTAYTVPEDEVDVDPIYYEEHDGGVALGANYQQGKGKPRPAREQSQHEGHTSQQDQSGQAGQQHVGQGSTEIWGIKAEMAQNAANFVSASSATTGRRADQPQNTTTIRPSTANDIDDNGTEEDVIEFGDDKGDVDGDQDDSINDLLGPLEAARLGVDEHMPIFNTVIPPMALGTTTASSAAAQGRPPRVSRARAPGQSAVSAAISSLTGVAGSSGGNTQGWWSNSGGVGGGGGEQLDAEPSSSSSNNDYDNRKQAWRQAMWQGW
ncbi:hypothetical protein Sste5346_002262 [Sporothrix stenoceras]|uniref:J domain-containing protein n=1 Tax=Sporothrix stenoceras TaxID=5173 RepID=A0ABR3ZK63_9PEZI